MMAPDSRIAVISDLLCNSGFPSNTDLLDAVVGLVDLLDTYSEEGKRLYPEAVLTTSLDSLLAPVARKRIIPIGETATKEGFTRAIKRTAPMARAGWVSFLETSGETTRYGVFSVEASELSPSPYVQLVGELSAGAVTPVAYLRSVGNGQVEVRTQVATAIANLRLSTPNSTPDRVVAELVNHIVSDIDEAHRSISKSFMTRLIQEGIREGHGCIIAVCRDAPEGISALKERLTDGVLLDEPIRLHELLLTSGKERGRESSTEVRSFAEAVKGMIAQDGITVFSTRGAALGFNVFVDLTAKKSLTGGARRRAFDALCGSGLVTCAVAVSQDGAMHYWEES